MSASTRTRGLAVFAGLLALLDVAVHRPDAPPPPAPRLPVLEQPISVAIHHGDDDLRLEREGDGWRLQAPVEADADPRAVQRLLAPLVAGLELGPPTDEGSLDDYVLSGHDAIRVTVQDEDGDEVDLWIGANSAGGRSWVRMGTGSTVHRADVGGRDHWTVSPGSLRNRTLWTLDPEAIQQIRVGTEARHRTARRDADGWTLAEDPGQRLDPLVLDRLAEALSQWSGIRVTAPDEPANHARAVIEVTVTTDQPHRVELVSSGAQWFARRPGQLAVSLSGDLLQPLLRPDLAWPERRLSALEPEAIVGLDISVEGRIGRWRLGDQGWVGPKQDAMPETFDAQVRALAGTRVIGWLDASARPELSHRVTLHDRDGRTASWGLAPTDDDGTIPARRSDPTARTGTIDARVGTWIDQLATSIE